MSAMFQGQVALVTGAASGIGRASARAFAEAGAAVMVSDIDAVGGAETVRLIEQSGGEAVFSACDVSDAEAVDALVQAVKARWRRLDFAHNNAGIVPTPVPLTKLPIETWRRVIDINLSSVFYAMRSEIPLMLTSGGGVIVNTASTTGLSGAASMAAYSASKHGVIGLTKSAALENAGRGIRINAVCPGAVSTPLLDTTFSTDHRQQLAVATPMKRIGDPAEIAATVIWLCSGAASYVTGAVLPIDGGTSAG